LGIFVSFTKRRVQSALAALDSQADLDSVSAKWRPLVGNVAKGKRSVVERIARGGIRTPWTDVPTVRLSGKGDPKSFIGMLAGSGVPLTKAELAALYPGGKEEYLRRFTASLDAAIRAGHIVRDDRQEILDIAAINFDAAP
jgi:hypothetical protein